MLQFCGYVLREPFLIENAQKPVPRVNSWGGGYSKPFPVTVSYKVINATSLHILATSCHLKEARKVVLSHGDTKNYGRKNFSLFNIIYGMSLS